MSPTVFDAALQPAITPCIRRPPAPQVGGEPAAWPGGTRPAPPPLNPAHLGAEQAVPGAGLALLLGADRWTSLATVGQAPEPSRDALTGLPDRASLQAHLDQALGPVALLAVDVDGFRQINEEAGHDTGDHVLIQISRSLTRLAPPGGIAARLDGDDFLLTVPGDDIEDAWALATHTQRTLRQPVDVAGRRFHLNANVGIVLDHTPGRQHRHTAAEPATKAPLLLRCVDAALAAAQASPTGIAVHDEQTCRTAPADPLLEIVDDLHAALATDDQIQIHVQPQYALHQSGSATPHSLSGCEALVRWQHPTRGLLGPGVLMRAARAGHLHRAITERVLELSIAAAATWWPTHQLTVSVNLTTEDLDDESLPHRIAAALAHHGLPAAALTVEVVEDSLMLDPPRAVRTLTALRAIGLTIAVDDYGTGYSSLAYLHRLPIDEVKFDRSLTAGVADDHAATAIVRHSVRLAHDLGLTVVAEGVERPQDLQRLRELGCDTVQGYLTGRPVPLAEWNTLLIAQAPSA